jgi:hypothetical protein
VPRSWNASGRRFKTQSWTAPVTTLWLAQHRRIVRVPFRRSDDRPHRTWLLHCGRPLRCSAFSWLLARKGSVAPMGRRHRGAANYPIDRAMEWMSLGLAGDRAAVRALQKVYRGGQIGA